MKGGFKPGRVYQLAYESSNPPVAGVGFAAVRDLASAVKYNSDALVHGKYVYTFGSSQVGRWQRQMMYEGFTVDEQGRRAVDALFIQTGGTGLGSSTSAGRSLMSWGRTPKRSSRFATRRSPIR